ncbi:MAG TPA: CPBP family intramembrane glutamic endopeptidase, partial [Chryseolinea sp.]
IASWLILRYVEEKDLSVLGIVPTKKRVGNFVYGIIASTITCGIYYLAIAYAAGGIWSINEAFIRQSFLYGSWWTFKSVLFEELIFRGALLYVLIQRLGLKAGCFISAFCFGIYHWFSYNVNGDIFQMIVILIMTGIAGLMFAFAFGITKSLYLPIGLHFGWNFVSTVVFSNGPLGKQFLILENAGQASEVSSTILTIFQLLALPLIVTLYLKKAWKEQVQSVTK